MYTVFGPGSVGTMLAALLADAGVDVAIAGRSAVSELTAEGEVEMVRAVVPVTEEPLGTILLCVHEPDVEDLAARWPDRVVISFANGIRTFPAVSHAIWRMTCTLARPGFVRFVRRGRVIVEDATLASALARAGLDVAVSSDIAADRWLKLFVNLSSAPNALIRREDHSRPEFGAVKVALLQEARALLEGKGIQARSCDGRDASVDEEIERQSRGGRRRERPVFNSIWRQLSRGRRPKERYHDRIVALGPAPCNAAMLRLLDRASSPECYGAKEVLSAIRES